MLKRVSAWVSSLVSGFSKKIPANRIIRYKTVDGKKISIYNFEGVVDHFYEDGEGVIIFEKPVTNIYEIVDSGRKTLESITIPEGITEIGNATFHGCQNLVNITIPEGVTDIGDFAFINCSSLETIAIPNSVMYIGDCVFANCRSLRSFRGKFAKDDGSCLIVQTRIVAVAPAWFTGRSYDIPWGIEEIGTCSFSGCSNLEWISIHYGMKKIGAGAFSGCKSLKQVYIPESVTEIGSMAFEDCSSLESISISNRVTEIRLHTFKGCSNLKSIYIPDSVEKIEHGAFAGCSSLESITCLATTPPTLGIQALPSEVVVYVPREALEAYKNHDEWGKYRIEAME